MRKTKSAILEAIHETAAGLHKAGTMGLATLRELDRMCLPPVNPPPPQSKKSNNDGDQSAKGGAA